MHILLFSFLVTENDVNYLTISSKECTFELTEKTISFAFTKNQLQNFVIPMNCLKIHESIGEGKI